MKSKIILSVAFLALAGFVYGSTPAPEKKEEQKKECTCKDGKTCDTCKAKAEKKKEEKKGDHH